MMEIGSQPGPNWAKIASFRYISDEELAALKEISKDPETVAEKFKQERLAGALLTLISRIEEDRTPLLQLIQTILSIPKNAIAFHEAGRDPYEPFFSIMLRPDPVAASKSAQIIAALLTKSQGQAPERILEQLIFWVHKSISNEGGPPNQETVEGALATLQILLREQEFRGFYASRDGVKRLLVLLQLNRNNFEVMYRTIYCFWVLAYNKDIAQTFPREVVNHLAEVLKTVAKEKVLRISLATLRNLLDQGTNNQFMIEAGILKTITTLHQNKKWGDEDVIEDLELLISTLEKNMALMSSFDMYKKEVMSRGLEWSPMHKRESFWRENAHKFEENNFFIINALVEIIQDPNSTALCLSVACNDLGEFVRFHPRGRSILGNPQFTGKTAIMKLMVHQDPEVQKQALLAVQKLMVTNWEYLSK